MELVVDTNILRTFFWEKSLARKLLMKMDLKLSSPEFALEEINTHKSDILKKTKISEKEFNQLKSDLAIAVEFIPVKEYKEFFKTASEISPDPNDADFFALALKLKIPLWSNDSLLKNQNKLKVFSTLDLLEKQEFFNSAFPDE